MVLLFVYLCGAIIMFLSNTTAGPAPMRTCPCGCGRRFIVQYRGHTKKYYEHSCRYHWLKKQLCGGMLPVAKDPDGTPAWRICEQCGTEFPLIVGMIKTTVCCPEFIDPSRECATKNRCKNVGKRKERKTDGGYKWAGTRDMAWDVRRNYCMQNGIQCIHYLDCLDEIKDTFSGRWKHSRKTCYTPPFKATAQTETMARYGVVL